MYDKWHQCSKKETNSASKTKDFTKKHINTESKESSASIDPVDQYLKEIRHIPLLTKDEEIHYARLAQSGDEAARKKMIESNLRLVVKIARRYLKSELPISDLIEEGNLGLMHAVEKFDPEKGFRFSTYSAWWIQQNIERAIMNQGRTVRVPVHIAKKINSCYRAKRELTKVLEYTPTSKDLANVLGKTTDDIERLLMMSEKALSIDSPSFDSHDKTLLDSLKDENADDPLAIFIENSVSIKINSWLKNLSDKHKDVIIKRYGLFGSDPKTLDQTGLEVGLTRERVRQLQTEGLKQLKHFIEADGNTQRSIFM